ncbi:hypothetical protein [Kitasatospora purpeofusca]|uniref:hypothetical protein n=1 Tax=Kitasatospora purpeofusca TaxID=67352 RepID=UPI00225B6426|nr:hypothetical protein [Kitasatospora purpeofusca]MCX4758840.1 hypothetical protein [Kitasatospora purpeofusca]WSR30734.1 hypothetical protein OG715_06990 [Kitasatospora purpeofusca]WSR38973.1 hypothetical protein OG196_07635 [Kitasatospora purpeofusca]
MADDENGDGGTVTITDNFLKNFPEKTIKVFLADVKTSIAVRDLRAFADGSVPFLTGNNSGNFTAPGTLATTLKAYDDSVAKLLGTVIGQFETLIIDLQLADKWLNNALDESLDYAQFMKLAGRTLNPGK